MELVQEPGQAHPSIGRLRLATRFCRNRHGEVGERIDFAFTEDFFEELSDKIGYYSQLGEYKIHWSKDLRSFGEKGVDCDLIMQIMDDLHNDEVDAFVIMTNDMDFFPLVERLREERKHVFLCGLRDNVSYRLIESVHRDSFFDLGRADILNGLSAVFMMLKKPDLRKLSLQWTWLALRREVDSNPTGL